MKKVAEEKRITLFLIITAALNLLTLLIRSLIPFSASDIQLFFDYGKLGFRPRLLLGSLLNLLGIDDGRSLGLKIFLSVLYITLTAVTVLILLKARNKAYSEESKYGILLFACFICLCPLFIIGFSDSLFGSVHIVLMLLSILSVFLINKGKALYAVVFICMFAILIDHVFFIIFFPLIAVAYMNKINSGKKEIRTSNAYAATATVCAVSFAALVIFSLILNPSDVYMEIFLGDESSVSGNMTNIYPALFADMNYGFNEHTPIKDILFREALSLISVSPFYVFFAWLWNNSLRYTKEERKKNKGAEKILQCCFLQLLVAVPSVIFFTKFSSWLYAEIFVQTLLVCLLVCSGNIYVLRSFEKLSDIFRKKPSLFVVLSFVLILITLSVYSWRDLYVSIFY